jgi:hypothetical protein
VREREEQVHGLALAERGALLADHVAHGAVVRVGEDHALRRARRAGRVDEDAGVVGGDGGAALVELGLVVAAAALAQVGERHRVVGRLAVDHDHVLEVREPVADLADLRELLLVLDEHRARLGVIEDVVALLGGVRLVDRDGRAAGGQDAEVRERPLGAGVREDRDALAVLEAEVDQPAAHLADGLVQVVVGDGDPLVADLVLDRRVVAVGLRGQRRQSGHRGCARAGRRADRSCFHCIPPSRVPLRGGLYGRIRQRRPSDDQIGSPLTERPRRSLRGPRRGPPVR